MKICQLFLLLCISCTFPTDLLAQKKESTRHFGIEGGPFISFTGVNFNLAANLVLGDHEFYLGPKWVLSDTYLIAKGPWGIDLGYRWNMVQRYRIQGFANIEYQSAFLRPAGNGRKVIVQELHGAYGLQWQLGEQLKIGNTIGLGGVVERSRQTGGKTYQLDGFSFLFKVFLNYRFKRKTANEK